MMKKHEYFGKYIIFDKLASGGMAEVFLARSPSAAGSSRFVALKRILPRFSKDASFRRMFDQEARIVLQLMHGNIVPIYEFGIEQNHLYLCMGYVHGRNLRQVSKKLNKQGGTLPLPFALYIAREVAAGLNYAHNLVGHETGHPLNVIHRDMSPHNIMLDLDGSVKIIDFGIAKATGQSEKTQHGALKGKFAFMSPEQVKGEKLDRRSDVFSLGVVLWESITGQRLFLDQNEAATIKKVQACHVPSLADQGIEADSQIETILKKALAKQRDQRYQHAEELQSELNAYMNKNFPHFKVKEFADFLNTLYTREADQMRKLLIQYAKVPFLNKSQGPLSPNSAHTTRFTRAPVALENVPLSDFHKPQAEAAEKKAAPLGESSHTPGSTTSQSATNLSPADLSASNPSASDLSAADLSADAQTQLEPTLTSTEMMEPASHEAEENTNLSEMIASENTPAPPTNEDATYIPDAPPLQQQSSDEAAPPSCQRVQVKKIPVKKIPPPKQAGLKKATDGKPGPRQGYVHEGFDMRLAHRRPGQTNTSTLSGFGRSNTGSAASVTGSLPTIKTHREQQPGEQKRVDQAFELRDRVRLSHTRTMQTQTNETTPHRVSFRLRRTGTATSDSSMGRRPTSPVMRVVKGAVATGFLIGLGVLLFIGAKRGASTIVFPAIEGARSSSGGVVQWIRSITGHENTQASSISPKRHTAAIAQRVRPVLLPVASLPADGAQIYIFDQEKSKYIDTGLTTPSVVEILNPHKHIKVVKGNRVGYHNLTPSDRQVGAQAKIKMQKALRQLSYKIDVRPPSSYDCHDIYVNDQKLNKQKLPATGEVLLEQKNLKLGQTVYIEARSKQSNTPGPRQALQNVLGVQNIIFDLDPCPTEK